MAFDESIDNGYVQLRRNLMAHLEDGRLSKDQYYVLTILLVLASAETGTVKTSATSLAPRIKMKVNTVQDILRNLSRKGYITREVPPQGVRAASTILIHKYLITRGRKKDTYTPNSSFLTKSSSSLVPLRVGSESIVGAATSLPSGISSSPVDANTNVPDSIACPGTETREGTTYPVEVTAQSAECSPSLSSPSTLGPPIQEAEKKAEANEEILITELHVVQACLSARSKDNSNPTCNDKDTPPPQPPPPAEFDERVAELSNTGEMIVPSEAAGTHLTKFIYELLGVEPPTDIRYYAARFNALVGTKGYTIEQVEKALNFSVQGGNKFWINTLTNGTKKNPIAYITASATFKSLFDDYRRWEAIQQIQTRRGPLLAAATERQRATQAERIPPDYAPLFSAPDQKIVDNLMRLVR